jgi:hypothetical protein
MTDITLEDRIAGLRGWVREHDASERAAVELLIWKESWLRRPDFISACIRQVTPRDMAVIDWHAARRYLASPPQASSSEIKILDLAIALGACEYPWLTGMGHAHKRAIVDAVTAAMGLEGSKDDG